MIVKKQFASDGGGLDASMDQLIEVLAQMLEEPKESADGAGAAGDLHSADNRVIHVVVQEPKK